MWGVGSLGKGKGSEGEGKKLRVGDLEAKKDVVRVELGMRSKKAVI